MDKSHIYTGAYKGWFSVIIESESLRVEMLPRLGGKLVSLIYKPTGKEWLIDSGERALRQPEYGSVFTDWDISGWDECFPTIIACPSGIACPTGGDKEIHLPDHGELWSLPWDYALEEDAIVCTAQSPQLSYQFTRRISFQAADRILMEYKVDNVGGSAIPFLWVPHPQFVVTEPTRILLPPSVKEMLCVFGGNTHTTGEMYDGESVSLLSPNVTGNGMKFYCPDQNKDGWSGLLGLESRNFIIVSVPSIKVPYIGVWIDAGMFNDRAACTLEPGIGYYDSLAAAQGNGTAQIIPPYSSYEWHLNITLGNGDWDFGGEAAREAGREAAREVEREAAGRIT